MRHRRLRRLLLRSAVAADNWCYRVISTLAIVENDGVHPKHTIIGYHTFFVDHVRSTDRVIDIGCGNGANAFDIAGKAKMVVGIDIKEKNISYARAHYARPNCNFVVGDIHDYQPEETFDVIVLSNVLEHIDDRTGFLRALHRLAPTVLLRVPLRDRDWLAVYKYEHGFEYRLDPTHTIEYTVPELITELAAGGWAIQSSSIQFGEFWGVLTA